MRPQSKASTAALALLVGVLLAAVAAPAPALAADELALSVGPQFRQQVDLSQIRIVAVQEDGRVKTFDSLAREKLRIVNASKAARATDPVLWYLDFILAPQHHATNLVININKKAFRNQLIRTIRSQVPPAGRIGLISEAELKRIEDEGIVTPMFLDHPAVGQALAFLERDLMSTSKEVNLLNGARALSDSATLASFLRVVPPTNGHELDPWLNVVEVINGSPHGGAGVAPAVMRAIGNLNPALRGQIALSWNELERSWRMQDAAGASRALNQLAQAFQSTNPQLYPSTQRLAWEHWYYRNDKLTMSWLVFFFALPFQLMAFVYGFPWARRVGLALFTVGFLIQTFSIVLRWWLAGRIPNANMFEAITASAWFGSATALVLELLLSRWPVKNLPALAASSYAMIVLMIGKFVPIALPATFNSDITTVMPVLDRTIWLYIHTNMIIASYALIFFGSVTAVLYLGFRFAVWIRPSERLTAIWAGAGGPGAVKGGAASIIMGRGLGQGEAAASGLSRTLDGATMIFLELAFITLWFGTILGAVWADVSWGRPWGWDPKEVFALNTWLVFLVLVHVRLKAKDKALWTALLAVIGCAVMLFNWIAVNFVIVGLHSYA